MSLASLPVEILCMVIREYVSSFEKNWTQAVKALKLRTVNRTFDQLLRHALFETDLVGDIPSIGTRVDLRTHLLHERVSAQPRETKDPQVIAIAEATKILTSMAHPVKTEWSSDRKTRSVTAKENHKENFLQSLCRISARYWRPYVLKLDNEQAATMLAMIGAAWNGEEDILWKLLFRGLEHRSLFNVVIILGALEHEHNACPLCGCAHVKADNASQGLTAQQKEKLTNNIGAILDFMFAFGDLRFCDLGTTEARLRLEELFEAAAEMSHVLTLEAMSVRSWYGSWISTTTYRDTLWNVLEQDQAAVITTMFFMVHPARTRILFGDALDFAAGTGQDDLMDFLLRNADWKTIQSRSRPELQVAARTAAKEGHLDILKNLRDHGADLNFETKHDMSPLSNAVWGGEVKVVEWLLENGAVPGTLRRGNMVKFVRRLQQLGTGDNTEMVKRVNQMIELLTRYGVFDANDFDRPWTLLATAAHAGEIDLVKDLLARGANPKKNQGSCITPLQAAIATRKKESCKKLVQLFLDAGLSPNGVPVPKGRLRERYEDYSDYDDYRPLAIAALKGRKNVMKMLTDKGAKPLEVNPDSSDKTSKCAK